VKEYVFKTKEGRGMIVGDFRVWKRLKGRGIKIHLFTINNPEKEPKVVHVFDGDELHLNDIKNAKIKFFYDRGTYSMTVEMEE